MPIHNPTKEGTPIQPKKETKVYATRILRIHPKLVTIATFREITINLPITHELYLILLRNATILNTTKNMPLVFFTNQKGIAFKAKPLRQIQEEAAKEKINATENTVK